jgi:hypothetical protein
LRRERRFRQRHHCPNWQDHLQAIAHMQALQTRLGEIAPSFGLTAAQAGSGRQAAAQGFGIERVPVIGRGPTILPGSSSPIPTSSALASFTRVDSLMSFPHQGCPSRETCFYRP